MVVTEVDGVVVGDVELPGEELPVEVLFGELVVGSVVVGADVLPAFPTVFDELGMPGITRPVSRCNRVNTTPTMITTTADTEVIIKVREPLFFRCFGAWNPKYDLMRSSATVSRYRGALAWSCDPLR